MASSQIQPISDQASVSYSEKMSWIVRKEDLDGALQKNKALSLCLKSIIPGTYKCVGINLLPGLQEPYPGGFAGIDKKGIGFGTNWPKDVDLDRVHIHAKYKIKTTDGKFAVDIKGQTVRKVNEYSDFNFLRFLTLVTINTDKIYDEVGSFIVEADLLVKVKMKEAENPSSKVFNLFGEEIKSILNDEKNSDVMVIAGDREFKCHKAILSARSVVFKNTFAHNTVESANNAIVIKESPAQVVEDMLKYVYSGDVPEESKRLTTELLHIANMYQLHPVVEACLKNLVESLDVSSCISTLMLVDRYVPQDQNLREKVTMFMQCKALEVVDEEDWDMMMESHPNLGKEIVKAIARASTEKHRCQFCVVTYN